MALGQNCVKILVLPLENSACTKASKLTSPEEVKKWGCFYPPLTFVWSAKENSVCKVLCTGEGCTGPVPENYTSITTDISLVAEESSQPHLGADKVDTDLEKTTLSVFCLFIPGNTVLFLGPLVFVTISRAKMI